MHNINNKIMKKYSTHPLIIQIANVCHIFPHFLIFCCFISPINMTDVLPAMTEYILNSQL